jgi:hypothetical protein
MFFEEDRTMIDPSKTPASQPAREDRKLRHLAQEIPSARELADKVASTSEATAQLFNSEYSPESELGEELPPQRAGSRPQEEGGGPGAGVGGPDTPWHG